MYRLILKRISGLWQKPPAFPLDVPTLHEEQTRTALQRVFPGKIVFDSNRNGKFGIFSVCVDGSQLFCISEQLDPHKRFHYIYPDVSPDKQWIVCARSSSLRRTARAGIWLMRPDGTEGRRIAKNGTFPTFSSDGARVYFERGRKAVYSVTLSNGKVEHVFPTKAHRFSGFSVIKPRVSPDGKSVAFISNKLGRWNSWIVDLQTGTLEHIGDGCEPCWYEHSDALAWIKSRETKGATGIYKLNRDTQTRVELQDSPPPRGHEYFPTVCAEDQLLLYAACRDIEHSHIYSNYQLFVKNLTSQEVVRITFDTYTNRWPKLL